MLGTKNFDRMRNHLVWPAPWSQLHLGTCPGPQKLVRGKVSDGQLPKAKSVSDADSFLHALVLFVCSLLPSTKLWSGRQLHLHGWTLTTGLPWWFGTNSRFRAGIVVTLAKNWVFQTIMVTLYRVVQKNCPLFKNSRPYCCHTMGPAMHSPIGHFRKVLAQFSQLSAISFAQPCTL